MKASEWREELKAASADVEREAAGLAAAKEVVRSVQKTLARARQRKDEVLRAFLNGESQMPLFDESVEDESVEEEGSPSEEGAAVKPGEVEARVLADKLFEACYSDDRVEWSRFRRDGATDAEILEKLRGIWPEAPTVMALVGSDAAPSEPWYTVRGGDDPAFWPFDAFPAAASVPARPTLRGEALCAAIRRALRFEFRLPERTSTADPVPDESPEEETLRVALHRYGGAADRWAASIATGETDDGLKARIGVEFGNQGGAVGDGNDYFVHGGANPRIWFNAAKSGKPSLQGNALVSKVRELLAVPYPEGGGE